MEVIFPKGSVPIAIVAKVYGKDAAWIRAGIVYGWLTIGYATYGGKIVNDFPQKGRLNYYISPKRLYEETGYLWRGQNEY